MCIQVVILCAGYGTRLQNDLEDDKYGAYHHLKGIPKPLLPIDLKPLIGYWFDIFRNTSDISKIILITNEAYKHLYEEFILQLGDFKKAVRIVSDGSLNNEKRSGAVACIQLGVKNGDLDSFIIAGDTLFDNSFNLAEMIDAFNKLKSKSSNVCLITSAPVREENVSKHGIIEVGEQGRVKKFLEKPHLYETASRLQSPCCYLMSKMALSFIDEFLQATSDQPLSKRDATGHFIQFLITKTRVFTFPVAKRYDIGNLASYVECCHNFK